MAICVLFYFFNLFLKYSFIWLHQVLVVARRVIHSPIEINISWNQPPQAKCLPWTAGPLCSDKQNPHPEQQAKTVWLSCPANQLSGQPWANGTASLGLFPCLQISSPHSNKEPANLGFPGQKEVFISSSSWPVMQNTPGPKAPTQHTHMLPINLIPLSGLWRD